MSVATRSAAISSSICCLTRAMAASTVSVSLKPRADSKAARASSHLRSAMRSRPCASAASYFACASGSFTCANGAGGGGSWAGVVATYVGRHVGRLPWFVLGTRVYSDRSLPRASENGKRKDGQQQCQTAHGGTPEGQALT